MSLRRLACTVRPGRPHHNSLAFLIGISGTAFCTVFPGGATVRIVCPRRLPDEKA